MSRNKITDLNIIDLSTAAIFVVLYAIILEIQYLYYQKSVLLDSINNTNYSEELNELADIPKVSSFLFLYATTVYLVINWFEIFLTEDDDESTEQSIVNSYNNFISTVFIVSGSMINYHTAQTTTASTVNTQVPEEEFL